MALMNQLISQFKSKAPGQKKKTQAVGMASVPQDPMTAQAEAPILETTHQFTNGSQGVNQTNAEEEIRTGRRTARDVFRQRRAQATSSRFNTGLMRMF